jgi:FtsH-binding integral membrane protein
MTTAAITLYLIVAAAFFGMTLAEGITRRLPWGFDRIMGLLLSGLWPLILVAIAVSSHRDRGNAG